MNAAASEGFAFFRWHSQFDGKLRFCYTVWWTGKTSRKRHSHHDCLDEWAAMQRTHEWFEPADDGGGYLHRGERVEHITAEQLAEKMLHLLPS